MRFLLFIPVIVLFLSNVPFIQKAPMEKMASCMKEKPHCNKQKAMAANSCHSETPAKPVPPANQKDKKCCAKTETTCVCIYCFQFMAPSQDISPFQYASFYVSNRYTGYIQLNRANPTIAVPWQPPDPV